jgi:LmbE family N-acetylglucosaminyl deacetylase
MIALVKRILVIGSHPDDETFGCGGVLASLSKEGGEVGVFCLTCNPPERREELFKAAEELGIPEPDILVEKEVNLDPDVIKKISDEIIYFKPHVVVTHLPFDYHREHRQTYELVKESIEWAGHTTGYENPWMVERLLLMEINTLIPQPHILIDITDGMVEKMEAIEKFKSQVAKFPSDYYQKFSRKKAELRGIQGDCQYAEAFLEESLPRNGPFYPEKSIKGLEL